MGIFPAIWGVWLFTAFFVLLALLSLVGAVRFNRLWVKGILAGCCLISIVTIISAYLTGFTFHLNTAAPVAGDRMVYIIPPCFCNPDSIVQADLIAVRVRDGHVQWRHPIQSNGFMGGVQFVSDDHNVYVSGDWSYQANTITALDGQTGRQVWQVTSDVGGRLVGAANGRVILADIHTTILLDAMTGKEMARFAIDDASIEQDNIIYSCTGLNNVFTITAIDESTGRRLWTSPQVYGGGIALGPGVLVDEGYGILSALRTKDGSLLWRVNQGNVESGMFIDGDTLFTSVPVPPDYKGNNVMNARRLSDGSLIWQKTMNNYPVLDAVSDGVALVESGSSLVALRGSDGKQLWSYPQADGTSDVRTISGGVVILRQSGSRQIIALDLHTGSLYWQTSL